MSDAYSEYPSTPTDVGTLTNLHSLAATNIWRSAQITQTPGAALPFVDLSFELHCDGSFADGDTFRIYIGRGDDASSNEIRDGGGATTEAELSAADDKDDVKDNCDLVGIINVDRVNHDVEKIITVEDPGSDFQIFIEADTSAGALDASGNMVRYKFWQPGDGS